MAESESLRSKVGANNHSTIGGGVLEWIRESDYSLDASAIPPDRVCRLEPKFALQCVQRMANEFPICQCLGSKAFAKRGSTRSVVQVATPHPKESMSSVQIGQPIAMATARTGQSSS